MKHLLSTGCLALALLSVRTARADIQVVTERNEDERATAAFKFKRIPAPSREDAATKAKFSLVDGEQDGNGGELDKLHDGRLPSEADEPAENFFFNAGTEGGRISVDLGSVLELKQVNTYSWHPGTRGPQVYKLYGSDGKAEGFDAQPKHSVEPEKAGWKVLAKVDTRPKDGEGGGQYGVSITDPQGLLGSYRYLLFDMSRTESDDDFGNTFYSEIDVVDKDHFTPSGTNDVAGAAAAGPFVIKTPEDYCEITIDTSGAPDLKEWAETKLAPVLAEWYPKLATMLASDGFNAPKRFSVTIRPGNGVAATGGTRVTANSDWLKREVNREGIGALLHEEVHVMQQYWGRRRNPDAKPAPGWLVEGIPDYIRWFLYEPQSHGADVTWLSRQRNPNLKYDALYRVTANFLDYVVTHYDPNKELIRKLNAACRQGKYTDEMWPELTHKTLAELDTEWRTDVQKRIAAGGSGGTSPSGAAASKQ